MPSRKCLAIGIGNPDRGDDAVGLIVAQRIKARRPADVRVITHSGESAGLLEPEVRRISVPDRCLQGRHAARSDQTI